MSQDLNDRGAALENKFAYDAELRFKAEARRNKLLGLWAAEQLGKSGDEAESYAGDVIAADLKEAGDEDVFQKIRSDFDEKGIAMSDQDIRQQMSIYLEQAVKQISDN